MTVSLVESKKMPNRIHAMVPVMADKNEASALARTVKYRVRKVEAYPCEGGQTNS